MRRLLVAFLLLAFLGSVLVSAASAYRHAGGRETDGITAALAHGSERYCGARTPEVADAYISTVDPHYAQADCGGGGHFINFLHRVGRGAQKWRVALSVGDGAAPCSVIRGALPEKVIRDFGIGGSNKSGTLVRC